MAGRGRERETGEGGPVRRTRQRGPRSRTPALARGLTCVVRDVNRDLLDRAAARFLGRRRARLAQAFAARRAGRRGAGVVPDAAGERALLWGGRVLHQARVTHIRHLRWRGE